MDVAFEVRDGAVYVLDLRDIDAEPSPRALQVAAGAIWLALGTADAPRAEPDIVRSVADEFGIEPEEITEQAIAFLTELKSAGLAHVI